MYLKRHNPVTPGTRQLVTIDHSDLHKGRPFKKLTEGRHRKMGHNNDGRLTSRGKGAGHKKLYRNIDFNRNHDGMQGEVIRTEYDPNRTAFISLVRFQDGSHSYILTPQKLGSGDKIESGANADIRPGNALPLKAIPVGTFVHNIEFKPGKGGQIARSAGTYCQIAGRDGTYILVRMPSGEMRKLPAEARATIGSVSNPDNKNRSLGKAGRSRWKGRRPHVRGVAMNPIDHPHGGGEGRTSGGRHPCTPWGIPTKGKKTRSNKRTSKFIVTRARKK